MTELPARNPAGHRPWILSLATLTAALAASAALIACEPVVPGACATDAPVMLVAAVPVVRLEASDVETSQVLVATAGGAVERLIVRLGSSEGEQRVVTDALAAVDKIIAAGLMRVPPGVKVVPELTLASYDKRSPLV